VTPNVTAASQFVDPRHAETMTVAEMATSVRQILSGDVPALSRYPDDLPHVCVERVYRVFGAPARAVFHDALLLLLQRIEPLELTQDSDWIDELLLLISATLPESAAKERAISLLMHLYSLTDRTSLLAMRALASLIALRYRAPPDYWKSIYNVPNERLAQIVIRGLALWSLDEVFAWLSEIYWADESLAALRATMPLFLQDFGPEALQPRLEFLLKRIAAEQRRKLTTLCEAIGLVMSSKELTTTTTKLPRRVRVTRERAESLRLQLDSWTATGDPSQTRQLLVEAQSVLDSSACVAALEREATRALTESDYPKEYIKHLVSVTFWYVDEYGSLLGADTSLRLASLALANENAVLAPQERMRRIVDSVEEAANYDDEERR
jgi:hypothetical protein